MLFCRDDTALLLVLLIALLKLAESGPLVTVLVARRASNDGVVSLSTLMDIELCLLLVSMLVMISNASGLVCVSNWCDSMCRFCWYVCLNIDLLRCCDAAWSCL
jgi:hypothetical protein